VSDIPENTDVISDAPPEPVRGVPSGLSFRLNDPADLADRLCELLSDPPSAARRGEMLREHVRAHFTLAAMYERTRQLYVDVSRGQRSASRSPAT
jgi:glycosyltransferase involved in cell wall biosynthesis